MISLIPMLRKPPKLKPLDLGDVMVAFINQQHTVDYTHEYRRMLGCGIAELDGEIESEEKQLVLPEFAGRELRQVEIMDYLIKNRVRDTVEYQEVLERVNQKIKIAIFQYSDKLRDGQNVIQQLKASLSEAYNRISIQRKYLITCIQSIKTNYSKIVPTLRKISNIKKVIQVMSIWKQSKLPYLFSVDVMHPERYQIEDVLAVFKVAEEKIEKNVEISKSQSLKKILQSLKQKHGKFINSVYEHFVDSVIHYTNAQEYRIKYQQYLYLKDRHLCIDILSPDGIKKLIQTNSSTIYFGVLIKLTPNLNVDLLTQSTYINFYDSIAQQYIIYFRSWHHVTTYHLDNNTGYGQIFLQSRKLVLLTLTNRISLSIENSKKFISLQYKIKLELIQMLYDYLQSGEKWMGNCQNIELPKVVVNKLNKQLQNIFGLYNNLIKNILTQQLSVLSLKTISEIQPLPKPKTKSSILSQINYQKISQFLTLSTSSRVSVSPDQTSRQNINFPEPPEVKLKIGSTFVEMIEEYLQRSKYLEKNKVIYVIKIVQHFQFILFMMYQVCISDGLKQKLNLDVEAKLESIDQEKGQQISVKDINQLTKIAIFQRQFSQILQFLKSLGSKYNGTRIAGIIDVNKIYDHDNVQIIQGYIKLVSRVVSDLLKILRWLIECIIGSRLKQYKECGRFSKLIDILILLFQLIVENNVESVNRKYVENVGGCVGKLKWEIKKFNQETASFYREYRDKLVEMFKTNTVVAIVKAETPQLADLIENKEIEILYRSLLECYGKIEKINDNGRQLIRMDSIDISKTLCEMGMKPENWLNWFEKYMDFTVQHEYKNLLEKIMKIGVRYQPICWKYQLMWVVSDFSSKQKKQYNGQLTKIYLGYLSQIR